MATIKIDDKDYDVDDLSEDAKAQVLSLNFVDAELNRLQLKVAAMQTARNAYASALNSLLGEDEASEVETSEEDYQYILTRDNGVEITYDMDGRVRTEYVPVHLNKVTPGCTF